MWHMSEISKKRWMGVVIGNILIGIGIGVFKYSNMGNDPFSAMALSLHRLTPLSYAVFLAGLNTGIFLIEWIFGRKYIGIGTIINWFLVGFVVQWSIQLLENTLPELEHVFMKLMVVLIGLLLTSLGLSLYQTAGVGVAPFDSMALILHDSLSISYFWARIISDGICVIIALMTGGLIGLGTLVCVIGFGPVVSVFNRCLLKFNA